MAKEIKTPDSSLNADICLAGAYAQDPASQPLVSTVNLGERLDTMVPLSEVGGDSLFEAAVGLKACLEKLQSNYGNRLFCDPSDYFHPEGMDAIAEADTDPNKECNGPAYRHLLADMFRLCAPGRLSQEDWESLSGINGRELLG